MRSRPLLVVLLAALLAGPSAAAAAGHPRFRKAHGRWTNPAGACVDDLKLGTGGDFRCSGSSHWTGTFAGDTTWVARGNQDPVTMQITGTLRERFRGVSSRGDHGRLRFAEHFTQSPTGHIVIHGHVIGSRRGLRGTRARVTWRGTMSATTGVGMGHYRGRWRPAL